MTACGFPMTCGRRFSHRGHHGGWRTGVRVVVPMPLRREGVTLGRELTPRALLVVAETIQHGSVKEAAHCLGIAEQTAKGHLAAAYGRTGASNAAHLAHRLGWTTIPTHLAHREAAS